VTTASFPVNCCMTSPLSPAPSTTTCRRGSLSRTVQRRRVDGGDGVALPVANRLVECALRRGRRRRRLPSPRLVGVGVLTLGDLDVVWSFDQWTRTPLAPFGTDEVATVDVNGRRVPRARVVDAVDRVVAEQEHVARVQLAPATLDQRGCIVAA